MKHNVGTLVTGPLARHLARGAVGFATMLGAIAVGPSAPWLALILIGLAVVAFRGCPTCWLVGFGACRRR